MDKQVSIIIVNYNTEKLLEDCILSVKEKTNNLDYEIIVIDNDSKKYSLDYLINSFPDVRFELTGTNRGFGSANNTGAKMAKGKYLLFLNPDTLLINNAIHILYQYMESHPEAGACGGNMYKGDMTPASSYYDTDFLLYEYKIVFNVNRPTGFNRTGQPKAVGVIVGADLMVRKDIFEKVGAFDEDFFMYFEEAELCKRIEKSGYKIMSVPQAEIIHLQGGSAENKNQELKKWSYQEHWYSKLIYFSKTKGKFQTRNLYFVNMLKLKLAVLLHKVKGNTDKLEYWELKKHVMKKTFDRYQSYLNSKN